MNKKPGSSRIDITSIIKDVTKEWWVILLLSISVSLFADVWVSASYTPEYTVSSTFVVTSNSMNSNVYQNLTSAKELAQNFSTILQSTVLKKKVAEELGMSSFDAQTSVSIVPETNLMELKVISNSAMKSYRIMKSIMNNYNSVSDYIISNVILEVLQQPTIPMAPSNPLNTSGLRSKCFLLTAALLCGILAVLSYMKDTVKNKYEVEEKIDAKLLGTIYHEKKVKSVFNLKKSKSVSMLIQNPLLSFGFVEANKMAAARIRSQMHKRGDKVLLITSVTENEGKSTVAANIAMALAQENKRVLLIDCDFRKPAQYKIFGAKGKRVVDLPKVLSNKAESKELLYQYKNTSLYTILNKQASTELEELLEYGSLQRILEFAKKRMDYIIMDTSPVALVSDTEELAQLADSSVLVVRRDTALAKHINDTIDALNNAGSTVIGCIFNDAIVRVEDRVTQYRYGGHYGHYGYGGRYGKRAD
ncbi:MAG: polysaccharide biosynthesis tyrosine autokinase [Ruminococcus sp.]|nr:polysaccharide biosynthesis tyrosine autokinase [Ruminococcus sp.]